MGVEHARGSYSWKKQFPCYWITLVKFDDFPYPIFRPLLLLSTFTSQRSTFVPTLVSSADRAQCRSVQYFREIISNGDYLNSCTKKYTWGHSCWPFNTKFDDFWTCVTGGAFTLPIRLKRVDFTRILGISVFSQLL